MNRNSIRSKTQWRSFTIGIALPAILCAALSAAPATGPLTPKPQHGEAARQMAHILPREHLLRLPMSNEIAGRAWTNFFNMLDYEHVFFLQSDIKRFRPAAMLLDDKLLEGDVTFAFQVMEVFKERVSNRVDYVEKRIKQPFDLDRAETFSWKRKDAPWPESKAEWDELWRQRLQNELVTRIVSAELSAASNAPAASAKAATHAEAIVKRYQHMKTVMDDNDSDWVVQVFLSAFTRAYDPHTDYMSPSSAEDFNIDMKLSLIGIGAELTTDDGAAKINRLIPGGPAARDTRDIHLMPNDKIIAVGQGLNGEMVDTLHWPLNKVVRLIRGEKGTTVRLTVIPASDPTGTSTKIVDLVRDEVKLEEQAVKSNVENAVDSKGQSHRLGVIKIPAFYADMKAGASGKGDFRSVGRDVATALEKLREERVEGIAIDLRNNGGGALIEAVRVTGLFIPVGPVVQVKESFRVQILPDKDPLVAYEGPLVVLVNRLSASASEIVAGALQDYGRALIIGDSKTHGKGSVQTIVELDQGRVGQVKVTNANYFRISGSSTQLKGVTPDIVIPSPYDFYPDLGEDRLPNAIPWSRVAPAQYTPATGLSKILPDLAAASEKRRAADPRFAAYTKLLQRIENMNRLNEIPLGIVERRRMAESEKELNDLQRELDPDDDDKDSTKPDPKTKAKAPDLVLDESLRILAETVLIQPPVMPPAPNRTIGMPQWIQEWMRDSQ